MVFLYVKICLTKDSFEKIKYIDENGVEFWYGRELMKNLQYNNWQNFETIIKKAKKCQNSGMTAIDHFTDANKMVKIGIKAKRKQNDYKFTSYNCLFYFSIMI